MFQVSIAGLISQIQQAQSVISLRFQMFKKLNQQSDQSGRRNQRQRRPRKNGVRTGAAAVELAVCLPMFLLVFVATIDVCGMFHVQQSLKIAAYEGARVGIVPNAKAENVNFQCETILDSQAVKNYTVSLSPSDPSSLNVGDYFTVQVDVNFDSNAFGAGLYGGKILTKSVTLQVE